MINTYLWAIYSVFYDTLIKFLPYKELLNLVITDIQLTEGESVLDVGSGTGNFEKEALFQSRNVSITGVDNSNEMLSRSRRKCKSCTFIKYDINKYCLPFSNNEFNKVVSINVVYNVENVELFFQDINKVMKEGGLFVFTTSTSSGLMPVIARHFKLINFKSFIVSVVYIPMWIFVILINVVIDKKFKHYFYSEDHLKKALDKTGFQVEKSIDCYGGLNKLITAKKVADV